MEGKYIRLNDSSVSQPWVEEISAKNPALVLQGKSGSSTALFRFPPGRLAFPNLFSSPGNDFNNADSYSSLILFPSCAKLDVVHQEAVALMQEHFQDLFNPETRTWPGINYPFRAQALKEYRGFTPGCEFIRASSRFPPTLYGRGHKRIDLRKDTDAVIRDSFYGGAWVILVGRFSVYRIRRHKGVNQGLNIYMQSALFVGDDERLESADNFSFCYEGVHIPS